MERYYTDNANQQIVIALLRGHGIRKVIASPGGTNPALVASFQYDGSFDMYSCVDERSAAYMACGMAEESGEPVVICCTGATASRNYYPALTEAYYRKLPIIVLTCSRPAHYVGQLMPQVTDRAHYPQDILVYGDQLQVVKDGIDFENCAYKVNKALIKARQRGGGPVHLNIETKTQRCSTPQLPVVPMIKYVNSRLDFPTLPQGKIGIFIGSHKAFDDQTQTAIESFCEENDAVVLADHTSGYYGKYRVQFALIGSQKHANFDIADLDLLIHIGEVSGDYFSLGAIKGKQVWRINEDGEVRIRFNRLDCLFDMDECTFFTNYLTHSGCKHTEFYSRCHELYDEIQSHIPSLPLSHLAIAQKLAPLMPHHSVLHPAIMNALRSWNFFETDSSIRTNCNVGGFGIDGCISSLIGASLVHPDKLYFSFVGDLAFFYDLNSLGNRHLGANVRILLVNDGGGTEFKHSQWQQYEVGVDAYIAGSGHFGNQSKTLVKAFAENLGFEYKSASTLTELDAIIPTFCSPQIGSKPMLVEVFTTAQAQSDAWETIVNLVPAKAESTSNGKFTAGLKKLLGKIK